jgi:MoaA/NifB/PqqE/SkfB family radical SAM enzyme
MPNGDVFPCHVLVHPEFRCGNLRAHKLTDLCSSSALLGRLAALDAKLVPAVAFQEGAEGSSDGTACMGDLYRMEKEVWRQTLGLVQLKS